MPSKYYQRNFTKDGFYHIFNRGANKQKVFLDSQDYQAFTDALSYYLKFPTGNPLSKLPKTTRKVPNLPEQPIHLISYCLMPNHFHLLLKQVSLATLQNNISNLMRRLSITYAMYFNEKYHHSGTLFQGKFKNVIVQTEKQLLYLTKYIHRNPTDILKTPSLSSYQWSSYVFYLSQNPPLWLKPEDVLYYFSRVSRNLTYKSFIEETETDIGIISSLTLD